MEIKNVILTVIITIAHLGLYSQAGFKPNYDESKVPKYKLPDVLKTNGNKTVKDKHTWEKVRRPEILKQFEENVFGLMPKRYDSITYAILNKNEKAMGGK